MANPFDQFDKSESTTNSFNQFDVSPIDTALTNENITGAKAAFIRSIYEQESGSGRNTTTSNAGARGGMQIIPETFASVADKGWDIDDPIHNAQAGTRYASQMWDKAGGDARLAAAGYYGGPGGLEKARKGIAVRDPRNPKAPSTLEYGEQVASRMPAEENPFDQFDAKSTQKPAPAPKAKEEGYSVGQRIGANVLAASELVTGLPGAIAGPIHSAVARWVAVAGGAEGKDISKFGHEAGAEVQQEMHEFFSYPIRKIVEATGSKIDPSKSGVGRALTTVGEAIEKGADWLSEKSGGLMTKEDAQDTLNAASVLIAPATIRGTAKVLEMTSKAAEKVKGTKAEAETAVLREIENVQPAAVPPDATPVSLAKQHIEEVTNLGARKGANKEFRLKQMEDARAAFADDAAYGAYLNDAMKLQVETPAAPSAAMARKLYELEQKFGRKTPQETVPRPAVNLSEAQSRFAAGPEQFPKPTRMEDVMANLDEAQMASKYEGTPRFEEVKPILEKPLSSRTPDDINTLRSFNQQGGSIDPKVMAKMAAIGLGVTAGIYLDPDNPIESGILGGLGGALAPKAFQSAPQAAKTVKEQFAPHGKISIKELGDTYETRLNRAGRSIWQQQEKIIDLVPTPEARAKITAWLQGDKSIKLTDKEYQAAKDARAFFDAYGREGMSSGVLTNMLPDYVTNLWDLEGSNASTWGKVSSGMSQNSKFNLQRKIGSLAEGKALGLKPVTEDIAVIMGLYGNSLTKTMANRQLITSLKETKVPDSADTLVMSAKDAPKTYVGLDHPALQGMRVHPDIKPSLDFFYTTKNPNSMLAAIEAINFASKRSAISFSLFHAKSLGDAFIGSGGNPLKAIGMFRGTNKFLEQIKKGGAGDIVDKAYEGGLKFSFEKGKLVDEDVGADSFYSAMKTIQNTMDSAIPKSGKLVKAVTDANHFVDKVMWERIHAGMKLEIFAKNYETLRLNNAKAHERNPDVPLKTNKQLAEISAEYANASFGGLNWRRMAENAESKIARDLGMSVYGPTGRRTMQFLLFAPDWTISTTKAAVQAFAKGSEQHGKGVTGKLKEGVRGLIEPKELADLHRQYLIRSAAYYLTVGNALNYLMSGHSIFENEDPTFLELGDGRRMQFSKHAMEPVHWLEKPGQQGLNKLGLFPSELGAQIQGKQWLSTQGAPEMDTSTLGRLQHAAKRFLPFSAGAQTPEAAIGGALGFPIYGLTPEQKREAKKDQQRIRRERQARADKSRKKPKKDYDPFR